jgi:hypothetical protein
MGALSSDAGPPDISAGALENAEAHTAAPEVSVVIPCLNEAETLPACIAAVQRVFRQFGIAGEVVVADNGSVDGSSAIARQMGARVVRVDRRGYGSALRGGIGAARGQYVITGDADNSHDFSQIPAFLAKLREGYDLVIGNRFEGTIQPGAMPWLHRYLGTPLLTRVGKLFFRSPCGDQQCGFRGLRREAFARMGLRAPGMEFASEMVVKAACLRLRIAELPTTQFPAGRQGPPHLRTWQDGWRHLRLMLLHSPRWLFLYPGAALVIVGLAVGAWLLPGPRTLWDVTFDIHTLLYASTAVLLGFQSLTFAALSKLYAIREGLLPADLRFERLLRRVSLEVGLAFGAGLALLGLAGSLYAMGRYTAHHFGNLDPVKTMRLVIPATVSLALGGQIVLSSFLFSILLLGAPPEQPEPSRGES